MRSGVTIQKIKSVLDAIANPRTGDRMVLDIDEVLLLTSLDKYEGPVALTQKELVDAINMLRERGIRVFGLTARKKKFATETFRQLEAVGIRLDYVLHAPNEKDIDGIKQSTKGKVLKQHVERSAQKPLRLCVVDDRLDQLEAIIESFKDSAIPLVCYHYARPQKQLITLRQTKQAFPENLDGFSVVQSLGGSTESTFLITNPNRTKDGSKHRELVLKLGAHDSGIKIEILCNAIYRILGVNVPDLQVYNTLPLKLALKLSKCTSQFGIFAISEYIKPGDIANAKDLIKAEARKHFVAHVLLGNIDIAKKDTAKKFNFIVDATRKVFLIDSGANFIYRAKGEYRKEAHSSVSELATLRDASFNKEAAQWFASLTEEDIKNQVVEISKHIKKIERTAWHVSSQLQLDPELREDFINALAARLDYLIEHYCPEIRAYPSQDKIPHKTQTAAGILTYTLKEGEYQVLLGKRVRHNYWANFGGKSEKDDLSLAETALREVGEESGHTLTYTEQDLLAAPSHDLMSKTTDGKPFSYRMYIAKHDWVDPDDINDDDAEHTAYNWIPLSLLLGVANGVSSALDIEIYEPLLIMLRQTPVRRNLERLLAGEAMLSTHTSSMMAAREAIEHTLEHKTRPMMTATSLKQQMADTVVKKSDVMIAIDALQAKQPNPVRPQVCLSQSEIHMKMLLRDRYIEGDVKENVCAILDKYFNVQLADASFDEESALVEKLTKLINDEKLDDSKIYFYHATSDKIEFAYDLYSAIFRILRADPQWVALRMSNDKFHSFTTITEFIAHYTKDGVIDNLAGDYLLYAISANLFVFGNHDCDTRCSIDYLIGNKTFTHISLKDILKLYFKSFEFSSDDIKALKSIYKKYMKGTGGVLHQLAVAKEVVADHSYPAGRQGILNYFGDYRDIPDIIEQLRIAATNNQMQHRDYIRGLQARLLVKPTLMITANRIKYKPALSPQVQAAYQSAIKDAAITIVKSMLRAANSTNASAIRRDAPIVMRLQELHQLHGIPSGQVTSQRFLLKQLIRGRVDIIKSILIKNPELRFQTIEHIRHANLLKKKHRSLLEPENNGKLTPFDMMLALGKCDTQRDDESDDERNTLNVDVLREVYGTDWPVIAAKHADSFERLCKMLSQVPNEQQLRFVQCIDDKIVSFDKLKLVTDSVRYVDTHLEILRTYDDLIEINDIRSVVDSLKAPRKIQFALFYINSAHTLHDVLSIIDQINALNDPLLQELLDRIISFSDLLIALENLATKFRSEMLKRVAKNILFSGDIREVLNSLTYLRPDSLQPGVHRLDCSLRDEFILSLDEVNQDIVIDKLKFHVSDRLTLKHTLRYLPRAIQQQLILKIDSKLVTDYLKEGINNITSLYVALRYLPIELRYQLICSIDKKVLLSFLRSYDDVLALDQEVSQTDSQQFYDYLELSADRCARNSDYDFRLSMAYLNETLKTSQAPLEQKRAACKVRDVFYQASRNPNCSDNELLIMSDKLRLVADVLDDENKLSNLIASMRVNPVTHGQPQIAKIITGALLAFIGVSVCVAGLATFIATGGLSTPLSIGAFTIGIKLLITSLALFSAANIGMSLAAGFFAYSGRKQGAALVLDEFRGRISLRSSQ